MRIHHTYREYITLALVIVWMIVAFNIDHPVMRFSVVPPLTIPHIILGLGLRKR